MNYTRHICRSRILALLVVSLASQIVSGLVSTAHAAPPAYDVHFIGGFPRAVNNTGDAVGWTLDTGVSRGWVFEDGSRTLLPVPAGWHSQANDINDNGVIVGNAGSNAGPTGPVLWQPNGNGYDMKVINTPVDDAFGQATAINNFSDIVGTRTFMSEIRPGVFTQITRGFLYSSSGVLTPNLSDIGFEALPTDINDNGQIVGGQLRKTQSLVEDLGVPSGQVSYIITDIRAINNMSQVAARTVLATSSTLSTASRYSDGIGWQELTFQGSFDAGLGINDSGDVTFEASFFCASGAGMPGVFLEGEGSFCLEDLLDDQNWQLDGPIFESDINNNGQILVQGVNDTLGLSGAVLLTPGGAVVVPAAPQGLNATVVTAVSGNLVQLSWTDASDNETGFRVERRLSGSSTWNTITTEAPNSTAYEDNTVDFDETYEYRVFATGLAGDSATSNVVTAVSPPSAEIPVPGIKANNSDGPLQIAFGTLLQVDVSLVSNGATGQTADWWLVIEAPDGRYWYDLSGSWVKSASPIPTYGGALFDITSMTVLNSINLPIGSYRIYFGVDTNANGILDSDVLFSDTVDVNIQ